MTLSKQLDQRSYRVVRVEKIEVFLQFIEDFANRCLKDS